MERYNHLNNYYKKIFGERTLKICIDGGFTCPNRDGTLSTDGCIFCSKGGSGEHLKSNLCIANQVKSFLDSYRGKRANKFIVYFQSFSNTYDSINNLKVKYDSALIDSRIVGISIATRPDCINNDVLTLIKTYEKKYKVFVELGLQTGDNEVLSLINTCYSKETFINAVKLLREYNIDVIAHIIVGLPGETDETIKDTIQLLNSLDIQGIKIHSCYVLENTKLCDMYKEGLYTPITLEYYLEKLAYIITHINPNIIIHRISGDSPKDLLIAPSWSMHKKWVLNGIEKILKANNLYQGMYFNDLETKKE